MELNSTRAIKKEVDRQKLKQKKKKKKKKKSR